MIPTFLVHVSSMPPTACGIAEYTASLAYSLRKSVPQSRSFVVRMDLDRQGVEESPDQISINPNDDNSWSKIGEFINRLNRSVILLQHEFKLFGGADGDNITRLFNTINAPVVTTLHTVHPSFNSVRHKLFTEIIERSRFLVVHSPRAADILVTNYRVDSGRVQVIPHGVPDVLFQEPDHPVGPSAINAPIKFITAGLLRPSKGIEDVLAAFKEVVKTFTAFRYIICGQDHPKNLIASAYRTQLMSLVQEYNLQDHVTFVDRFLKASDLICAMQACHATILAYKARDQSSSGVLALALACGRPVIATRFQYAEATLSDHNGTLVPMGDKRALAEAIRAFCMDTACRDEMGQANYKMTRSWVWPEVARSYARVAKNATAHSVLFPTSPSDCATLP